MGIAKGVQAFELKVRFPVIVAKRAPEVFENPHGYHRLAAPFGMRKKQRPLLVANTVQPETLAIDVEAGFVGMQQRLYNQLPDHNHLEARQQLVGFPVEVEHRAGAERDAALVAKVVDHALIRDQLLLRRIDRLRLEPDAVLDRSGHSGRKLGDELLARGILQDLGAIFRHVLVDLDIDDLPGLKPAGVYRPCGIVRRSTAMGSI